MELTERLLETGLDLRARGLTTLSERMLSQAGQELYERNRVVKDRLYPVLADARYLQDENERLERLAQERRWESLLDALRRQLARERRAINAHSFS